jgi:hypothetical protein
MNATEPLNPYTDLQKIVESALAHLDRFKALCDETLHDNEISKKNKKILESVEEDSKTGIKNFQEAAKEFFKDTRRKIEPKKKEDKVLLALHKASRELLHTYNDDKVFDALFDVYHKAPMEDEHTMNRFRALFECLAEAASKTHADIAHHALLQAIFAPSKKKICGLG